MRSLYTQLNLDIILSIFQIILFPGNFYEFTFYVVAISATVCWFLTMQHHTSLGVLSKDVKIFKYTGPFICRFQLCKSQKCVLFTCKPSVR